MLSPFKVHEGGQRLVLRVHEELRDVPFAAFFGKFQHLADPRNPPSPLREVCIDFSQCKWADPLPLLYIAMFLNEFRRLSPDNKTEVVLPSPDASPRLLKFLAEEGFIVTLMEATDNRVSWPDGQITVTEVERCAKLTATLAYCNCHLLDAQVLDCGASTFDLDQWCERASQSVEKQIMGKCPVWASESLVFKVRFFLHETLQNVVDHAYDQWPTSNRFVGVYVRFRTGLNAADSERAAVVQRSLSAEHELCLLDRDFLSHRKGCVEAFVVDCGIGLSGSLLRAGKITNPQHYPARQAFEAVFLEKARKYDKATQSEGGGLYLLHFLLSHDNDFVRGLDADCWMHQSVPLTRLMPGGGAETPQLAGGRDGCGYVLRGLAWTIRTGWIAPSGLCEGGWANWPDRISRHPYFAGFGGLLGDGWHAKMAKMIHRGDGSPDGEPVSVADFRYGEAFRDAIARDWKQWLDKHVSPSTQCVVVFPPRGLSKGGLIGLVHRVCAASVKKGLESISLILCDVPPEQARLYLQTLHRARFAERLEALHSVILVSRHLDTVAFAKDSSNPSRLVLSRERLSAFLTTGSPDELLPNHSYAATLAFITVWDSLVFWQHIERRARSTGWSPFVTDDVRWSDNLTIHGFMDFAQTLTDRQCVDTYRACLQRLQGVGASVRARLAPTDVLTASLLAEHNAMYGSGIDERHRTLKADEPDRTEPVILVGSVLVTGLSYDVARSEDWPRAQAVEHVNFFTHPDSTRPTQGALLLWPRSNWLEKTVGHSVLKGRPTGSLLERIGQTPAVAVGGARFFRVPHGACARSPAEAYQDWQRLSPCIVKIGHWSYEANHDLLTLDLWKAIYFDSLADAGVLRFLLTEILSALGVDAATLSDVGNVPHERALRMQSYANEVSPIRNPVSVLVYNSHPTTDFVIHELLQVLPEIYWSRIIGMRQLRQRRAGSSFLVSPLVLDRLRGLLTAAATKDALLFDDAAISGRNTMDIEALLREAGADQVHQLNVVDRRRLPTSVEIGSRQSYWRLDVPVMAKDASCPLCRALARARQFSDALVASRDVILQWEQYWTPKSPLTDWDSHGLDPVAISLANPLRLYPSGAGPKDLSLPIRTSAGLAVYLTELHTMTFRDDLVQEVLKEESASISPAARLQVLASQLVLFSQEFSSRVRSHLLCDLVRTALQIGPRNPTQFDSHLSLAALVLFAQDEASLVDLCCSAELSTVVSEWENGVCASPLEGHPALPTDVLVLLAYLVHRFPNALGSDCESSIRARRMLRPRLETIAHRYDQIFQEVYDESGTVHRRPLPILKNQDGCNLNDGLFLVRVRDAVHSCDKLQWLLEDVHVTHLRIGDGDRAEPSMAQLVVARKAVELCRQKAAVLLAERHRSWEQFVPVKRAIEEAIDGVSALLRLVCFDVAAENINAAKPRPFDNELLLLANRLRDEEDWREALKRLRLDPARFSDGRPVFRLSTHGELCPTSGKVVRTLWDGLTVPVVRHILCNVLHSDTCSPDPWQSEAGTADMWMRVTYHTHCTVLTLANSVSPGTPLQTPTLPTPTEDLGVQIRPALRARCWYTHLALPYLGQSQYLARTDVLKECWRMEALND